MIASLLELRVVVDSEFENAPVLLYVLRIFLVADRILLPGAFKSPIQGAFGTRRGQELRGDDCA